MLEDLDSILKNWPFEPGSLQVRIIPGLDGRDKIQLRIDLGVLQMETTGRPDGMTPFGSPSLLEYHEKLYAKFMHKNKGELFKLKSEDCVKLQQEGIQYYHRYLAFFYLEDFQSVIRDTEHNMRLLDFLLEHGEEVEAMHMVQHLKPYVLMMHTRAHGLLALQKNDYKLALKHVEWGISEIQKFLQENSSPEWLEDNSELQFLNHWMKELKEQRPLTPLEKLHKQMLEAVKKEDYERAARLRDALKELR